MPDTIAASEVAALLDEWLASDGIGQEASEDLVARTKTTASMLEGLYTFNDYDAIYNRLYSGLTDALQRVQQDIANETNPDAVMWRWSRLRVEQLPQIIREALGAEELAPPESLLPLIEEQIDREAPNDGSDAAQ